MSKKTRERHSDSFPYYCYCIILQDNVLESQFVPALFVCWDNRAHGNSQIFTLRRYENITDLVVSTTPEDIYELKALYKTFRLSIMNVQGKPRKTKIEGILVALRCSTSGKRFIGPAYYISTVNDTKGDNNKSLKNWQDAYLAKEQASYEYDFADVFCYEDGIPVDSNYILPNLFHETRGRKKHEEKSICGTECN